MIFSISLQIIKSLQFCLNIPFNLLSYYSSISIIKIYELNNGIEYKQKSTLGEYAKWNDCVATMCLFEDPLLS